MPEKSKEFSPEMGIISICSKKFLQYNYYTATTHRFPVYFDHIGENQVTLDEILKQVKFAMIIGMANQSPEVQAKWNEIPHDGAIATPEELLIYLSDQFRKLS